MGTQEMHEVCGREKAKVTKCLFPVAGLGTRFLPVTKEIAKEMLPLVNRPIISYGVEEALASGCSDIIMITGRAKRSIEDYFDRSFELEQLLKNVEVVVEDEVEVDKVGVGCRVRVLDMEESEEIEYKIVGSTEADSLHGRISNESPVGRALQGARIGNVVTVETPAGDFRYKVLSIDRSAV